MRLYGDISAGRTRHLPWSYYGRQACICFVRKRITGSRLYRQPLWVPYPWLISSAQMSALDSRQQLHIRWESFWLLYSWELLSTQQRNRQKCNTWQRCLTGIKSNTGMELRKMLETTETGQPVTARHGIDGRQKDHAENLDHVVLVRRPFIWTVST